MNKLITWALGAIAMVALILSVAGLVGGNQSVQLGAEGDSNFTNLVTSGAVTVGSTLTVGSSGSALSKVVTGTCNLAAYGSDALVAFTPEVAYCAATGVVSGDKVFVEMASTTNIAPVLILSSLASSTSGYIDVNLYLSTTTASSITAVGTSTRFLIVR